MLTWDMGISGWIYGYVGVNVVCKLVQTCGHGQWKLTDAVNDDLAPYLTLPEAIAEAERLFVAPAEPVKPKALLEWKHTNEGQVTYYYRASLGEMEGLFFIEEIDTDKYRLECCLPGMNGIAASYESLAEAKGHAEEALQDWLRDAKLVPEDGE